MGGLAVGDGEGREPAGRMTDLRVSPPRRPTPSAPSSPPTSPHTPTLFLSPHTHTFAMLHAHENSRSHAYTLAVLSSSCESVLLLTET